MNRYKNKRKLDTVSANLLKEFDLGQEAVWDCHGTWIILHKYLEHIATKKKVHITSLDVVESNTEKQYAVVKCVASSEEKTVITFGEASPKNNKNAYPFAMAEKRAVGRAILKLAGLHGHFYEDEFPTDNDKQEYKPTSEEKKEQNASTGNKPSSSGSQTALNIPGWDKLPLAEQVQTFSSKLNEATHPGHIREIATPFVPWIKSLKEEDKVEVKKIVEEHKERVKK
jgi:hypothetical protein